MLHKQTHINPTIAPVLLLRRIVQLYKPQPHTKEGLHLLADFVGFFFVVGHEAVVVEGYAVDDGDEEEGPVGAGFGDIGVAAVVDGEEDVGYVGEIGEGIL